MQRKTRDEVLSRRQAVSGILALGGCFLWACGTDDVASDDDAGMSSDADASNAALADTGTNTDPSDSGAGVTADGGSHATDRDGGGSATKWAGGGTLSMTGDYPNPFAMASAACVLATASTQGPCTEAADRERTDISEGYTGLPMRLALRVVDSKCKPIAGATVKVWHTQITGSYSGNTPNNKMCLKDQNDVQKHYFRGVQTSDTDGRVDFDSCFPGWYRGRALHIHFTVSVTGKSFTSQLVFAQDLVDEIFTTHPEYEPYGLPDTSNAADTVVGGKDLTSFTLVTSRMSDGALMAAKDLVVNLA